MYMDAAAESGRNPASKHQPIRFSLRMENEQADAGRDGRTRPRETKLSGANGDKEKNIFPVQLTHEQDWQPYPVDPHSPESADHPSIYTVSSVQQQKP